MMTLQDAIEHEAWCTRESWGECSEEHMQMHRWLVELEYLREENGQLVEDNRKLKELVRDMWDVALHPETFGDGSYLLRRMRDIGIEVE